MSSLVDNEEAGRVEEADCVKEEEAGPVEEADRVKEEDGSDKAEPLHLLSLSNNGIGSIVVVVNF